VLPGFDKNKTLRALEQAVRRAVCCRALIKTKHCALHASHASSSSNTRVRVSAAIHGGSLRGRFLRWKAWRGSCDQLQSGRAARSAARPRTQTTRTPHDGVILKPAASSRTTAGSAGVP